jgi:hypothetical protein
MAAASKSAQLQIRVSRAEKAAIRQAARRAGMDMSAYVLARVLPAHRARFQALAGACKDLRSARFELAELNGWLTGLMPAALAEALEVAPAGLPPDAASYVAAMVEYACARSGVAPPAWTRSIPPLSEPYFGSALASLRLYLLTHSPPPFRRRNIFIDSSVGDRV